MATVATDVVVVGGGALGSCVAYALARRGVAVTLLDASTPGRATSASAGGLWPLGESLGLGCGVIFHAAHGGGGAPEPLPRAFMEFLCASNQRFSVLAAELCALTGVNIEAESGTGLLYLLYDEVQEGHARRILEWLGDGREVVERWTPDQVRARDPLVTRDLLGAIHFPADNQVNPMLLAEALKRAATAKGAKFVAEARVHALRVQGDRVVAVESSRGAFACVAVVNAAAASPCRRSVRAPARSGCRSPRGERSARSTRRPR